MRTALILISSLAAGFVAGQDFGTVAACGQTCFNNMKGKIGGCAADNQKCHCDVPDYRNGLRDCVSQSCAAADVPLVQSSLVAYVDGVCNAAAAAPAPAPSASAAPAPSPAPTTPPPPPPAASTSAPPPATPTPATPTPAPSAAAPPAPVSSSSSATPAAEAPHASSSHSSSTSSSSSAAGTSTAPAAAGPTTLPKSESLSGATVAGIAIGSSAVALGLIGVLVCVCLHRRNRGRNGDQGNNIRLNISQPMPGSGRSYAGDHHNEKYESNPSLEDFKSRRYEDMLPRQTPRTMV